MLINVSSRIDERLKSFQPASEASRGHQGSSGLGEGLVHWPWTESSQTGLCSGINFFRFRRRAHF